MAKLPSHLRDPLDYSTTRKRVYDSVLQGLGERYPIENDQFSLELSDVHYADPTDYSIADQKKAILRQRSVGPRVRGTWNLRDKKTGGVVDTKKTTLMRAPYLTSRGTYILRGSEYTLANQMRLRSGVYARQKESGELESHFNILKGGPAFRVFMEPTTGVFRMQLGQSRIKLYPLLNAMGIPDTDMRQWWGRDLLQANMAKPEKKEVALNKAWARLANSRAKKAVGDIPEKDLRALLDTFKLDPAVTQTTLGKPYDRVTPEVMLRATQKLINISKGDEDTDDRDSLAFQDTLAAEDFFRERIVKDAGQQARKMLWKATMRKNLGAAGSGVHDPQIEAVFYKSGVGQPLEEINLVDAVDQNLRVIRLGEGGIPSAQAVPQEARDVQPSHMGFIDPVRSPESSNVGVDARLAYNTFKGNDKQLYTRIQNVQTGKTEYLPPPAVAGAMVAFPGELDKARKEGRKMVRVMHKGRMSYQPAALVQYAIPTPEGLFNLGSNMVPGVSGIKGGRLLMGGKMLPQALPLTDPEAPLVQSSMPDEDRSFENKIGKFLGAVRSSGSGIVTSVNSEKITIQQDDGQTQEYELYNNFPMNRKSYLSSYPLVTQGQRVKGKQMLAHSNMTNDQGTAALGKNLRVAYMPYRGLNYEDAVVISEAAARKLSSEHMYTEKMDFDNLTQADRKQFIGMFPGTFNREQLGRMDDSGIIREGEQVAEGDPLVLAVQRKTPKGGGTFHTGRKSSFSDAAVRWEHSAAGVVTDVWRDDKGVKVAVKATAPMEVGDKLSGRFGDKGVVAAVIPDAQMPIDGAGKALDILVNPLGVISRANPSQIVEAVLGKLAEKEGKPRRISAFMDEDMVEYAIKEMEKAGVSDTETVIDPVANREIPGVLVGRRFYMKLHHTAETKTSGRALGAYTAEGVPAGTPGGDDSPKRIGIGELQALVAHGAVENIRDAKSLRGQRNDLYWRAMAQGLPPPTPEVPMAYKKLLALMKGAGINIQRRGDKLHLLALTDRDIETMSSGEITKPETVKWTKEYGRGYFNEKSMDPISGGLFDRGITGGHGGNRWSHISLSEPLPQPAMEDPIRTLLDLTKAKYEDVIAGSGELPGYGSGVRAIRESLARIDPKKELEVLSEEARTATSAVKRDKAIKKLKYLEALDRSGTNPVDLLVTKVPVLPPIFRPVSGTKNFTLVAGSNRLYQDLLQANKNLQDMEKLGGGELSHDARRDLYKSFKAVVGLGDPIRAETQNHRARGLLSEVFGHGSPKYSLYQRKLMGTPVDLAARAVISPNPSLDMDQIGLPEDKAWQIYNPFVIRRLVQQMGNRPEARAQAIRMVSQRTPQAKEMLIKEMGHRPVIATRAPVLHKYGIMAFMPVLTAEKTLQLPPAITPGLGADFDGDTMNFHAVISDKAIEEAKDRMLPSRNLRSPSDFATMWTPRQEFLQGLYSATTKRTGRRTLPQFKTMVDILSAFKRGELNIDDVVSVRD